MSRIAIFVATSGHSGVDRVIANLAPAIAERGIEVDVLRVRGHGPSIPSRPDGLRVIDLPAAHAYTALPSLIRYLRNQQPDVLLSDKDRVNRVAILAATLARTGTRIVVRTGTTVSLDLSQRGPVDRQLTRWSMRYLYRLASAIILPSLAAADDFAETIGIPRERISVCPSPVMTPALLENAGADIDPDTVPCGNGPLIVAIGELSARKDHATVLRAFARLDPERQARLTILGEGRERTALERLSAELEISERFTLPGFVSNPYAVLARADVFVHSARLEGSPVVIMEALALGRPIVATDCPSGPREILQDGRYGHLVPIGDEIAMAEAIAHQLEYPPASKEIAESAARYSIEASCDAYLRAMKLERERD